MPRRFCWSLARRRRSVGVVDVLDHLEFVAGIEEGFRHFLGGRPVCLLPDHVVADQKAELPQIFWQTFKSVLPGFTGKLDVQAAFAFEQQLFGNLEHLLVEWVDFGEGRHDASCIQLLKGQEKTLKLFVYNIAHYNIKVKYLVGEFNLLLQHP